MFLNITSFINTEPNSFNFYFPHMKLTINPQHVLSMTNCKHTGLIRGPLSVVLINKSLLSLKIFFIITVEIHDV